LKELYVCVFVAEQLLQDELFIFDLSASFQPE